jgi:hypothetical protein
MGWNIVVKKWKINTIHIVGTIRDNMKNTKQTKQINYKNISILATYANA